MTNIPSKDIAKALKLSITVGKGITHDLVSKELSNASNRLIGYKSRDKGGLAYVLSDDMHKAAIEGIDLVNALLKAGIQGASSNPSPITGVPTNWKPLSKSWIKRKEARSRDLYWKNAGDVFGVKGKGRKPGGLALGFNNIANNYRRAINAHGPLVTTRSRKLIVGKPYKYDIRISLPTHRSPIIQRILAEAFVKELYLNEKLTPVGDTDTLISYLEIDEGRTSRPFIAKIMAMKGSRFRDELKATVTKILSSSMWSVKLKT
jgi:hypothetical protein